MADLIVHCQCESSKISSSLRISYFLFVFHRQSHNVINPLFNPSCHANGERCTLGMSCPDAPRSGARSCGPLSSDHHRLFSALPLCGSLLRHWSLPTWPEITEQGGLTPETSTHEWLADVWRFIRHLTCKSRPSQTPVMSRSLHQFPASLYRCRGGNFRNRLAICALLT
jgi:hypothetical protein